MILHPNYTLIVVLATFLRWLAADRKATMRLVSLKGDQPLDR
jgi:hypothetical protein